MRTRSARAAPRPGSLHRAGPCDRRLRNRQRRLGERVAGANRRQPRRDARAHDDLPATAVPLPPPGRCRVSTARPAWLHHRVPRVASTWRLSASTASVMSVPGLGKIAVLTSANHGKSWRQTSGQPSTAPIGHQPVSGGIAGTGSHLVATWVDIALASAVGPLLSGDEPPGTIRAATSADGGRTWSSPVAIAAVTSTLPRTAVAPDGSVLVSWEDGAAGGRVHLARSVNFGATWKVTAVAPAGHVGHGITFWSQPIEQDESPYFTRKRCGVARDSASEQRRPSPPTTE